jgi:hypothetical protein
MQVRLCIANQTSHFCIGYRYTAGRHNALAHLSNRDDSSICAFRTVTRAEIASPRTLCPIRECLKWVDTVEKVGFFDWNEPFDRFD